MNEQTLTILMPVYNSALYVGQAIESVQAQTHGDFVLHLFDDGSSDKTLEICRGYESADRRIRVYSHKNVGIGNTMNLAVEQVLREQVPPSWVFCMHGDDLMMPNRLERQWDFIKANPDLAVVSSTVRLIDHGGRDIGRTKSPFTTREGVERGIAIGQVFAFNHPMSAFKPDVVKVVGGYRQEFWPAEDTDLWNRIIAAGHRILVQDECLLKYRIHSQASSTRQARLMVQKLAWVGACIEQRQAGRPEPSFDEFIAQQKAAPWAARWNNRRKELARTLYQSSLHHFASREYAGLISSLAGATMLEPSLVLPRILPRLLAR